MLERLAHFFLRGWGVESPLTQAQNKRGVEPPTVPAQNGTPLTSQPGLDGTKNEVIVAQNEAPTNFASRFDSTQKGNYDYSQEDARKAFYTRDEFPEFAEFFFLDEQECKELY